MYAIVEIAGHQYKVRQDQQIYVNRVEGEEGDVISFDKVLLTDNDGAIEVGAPVIEGIEVGAKIVSHLKADKVIVFKKKRRKGYRKKNGHRQAISLIEITAIGKGDGKKAAKKAEPKKEAPKAEAPKAEATESTDLNSHTVAELRDMAKDKGITGYSSMKKDELIAALS
jgi:large subunit ribosomal protein L21